MLPAAAAQEARNFTFEISAETDQALANATCTVSVADVIGEVGCVTTCWLRHILGAPFITLHYKISTLAEPTDLMGQLLAAPLALGHCYCPSFWEHGGGGEEAGVGYMVAHGTAWRGLAWQQGGH